MYIYINIWYPPKHACIHLFVYIYIYMRRSSYMGYFPFRQGQPAEAECLLQSKIVNRTTQAAALQGILMVISTWLAACSKKGLSLRYTSI